MMDVALTGPGDGVSGAGKTARPFGVFERMMAVRYLQSSGGTGRMGLVAILSMVGIAIGAFGLIAVMSVMNGFAHISLSHIIGVQPHVYVYANYASPEERQALAEALRDVPGVVSATPMVEQFTLGVGPARSDAVRVIGVEPDDLQALDLIALNLQDVGAREGTLEGFQNGADGAVIGFGVARKLGIATGFSDARITVVSSSLSATPFGSAPKRKSFDIAATFRVGNQLFDGIDVYVPLDQAQRLLGRGDAVDYIAVRVDEPRLIGQFDAIFRADGRQANDLETAIIGVAGRYPVQSWRDRNAAYEGALRVERNMMRIILSIVILITALNIVTGLIMLSKNKARDVAILRTMGAGRGAVLRIFVMIGGMIGAVGTIAGIVLGALFAIYIEPIQRLIERVFGLSVFDPEIYYLSVLPARMEGGEVLFVAIWGFIISCMAALPPALIAASRDPVDTLRHE